MSTASSILVDKYFENKGHVLVKHLIDSYNDFILRKLDDIINGFNSIDINFMFLPDIPVPRYKYTLKIDVKNATISKPIITEKDGSTKLMTPLDARNRNFTYSSPIHVDIHINTSVFNEDTNTLTTESKKINSVCIGKIPIMLRSKYCILDNPANQNYQNECAYDYGGYFIVNGNEKVVISQDRIAENKTYVFLNNKVSAFSHIAEIRSVQENVFSVPKTTTLKMSSKSNQFGRFIRANIHHIKHDIPVTILMRALGIETDKEIVHYIMQSDPSSWDDTIVSELVGSIEDGNNVMNQREAFEYLSRHMNINGYAKEVVSNKARRLDIVKEILTKEFLPHVGPEFSKKALYIGYMLNKLLKCYIGYIPYDDRDSYINKRIDTPGILMANLFRQYYGRLIKDMKNMLMKDINNGSWKATNQFINVVNKVNISKLFKSTIIESGLKYGLATGNWGIKTNKTKQGVAQVLNRMTYNATLSHLRRINTPVEKTGKLIQPRKLHSTQWGIICPAETPEGVSVGLVKNMALIATITNSANSISVRDAVVNLGTVLFNGDITIFNDSATKVIVNGDLCGIHTEPETLYRKLKELKKTGCFNIYTSIVWHIFRKEIIVCTEGGRCVRPVVKLGPNNQLPSNMLDLDALKSMSWCDLVLSGAIEYLDVEETNNAMIAIDKATIEQQANKIGYTHMEVNPALIMGVLAASIPFSNHNQAPRNCYQSAMGKQAIGIYTSNYQSRFDTMGHVLNYPQKPIVQTKMAKLVNNDMLPCGVNVIVAIATWTGFNQEDSIIMNKTSVDRGLFQSTYYRTFKEQNNKNHSTGEEEFFCKPNPANTMNIKPHNYNKLSADGFVPENTYVESGDVIIGKCMPQKTVNVIKNKDASVALKNNENGYIDKNFCNDANHMNVNGDGYTFAKIRVRSERVPCIGDKFCVPGYTEVMCIDPLSDRVAWRRIDQITVGTKVLQLNPLTNIASFEPVQNLYVFNNGGNMYKLTGEHIDLMVTEDHKMFVANGSKAALIAARDLLGTETYYRGASGVIYSSSMAMDCNLAYIYGLYMCKGSTDMDGNVNICNTNRGRDTLDILKIGYSIDNAGRFISFNSTQIRDLFRESYEILPCVMASKSVAAAFLDGFFMDGSMENQVTGEFNACFLQLVALQVGLGLSVKQSGRAHTVTLLSSPFIKCDEYTLSTTIYDKRVYCLEVPSHVFLVRTNGKAIWTGNSSRHGQKGTVGMLYTHEDMPFTSSGLVPDIIMNPHAIPSRMTIAQLMECIMGKACCTEGCYGDASPFTGLTVAEIAKVLQKHGLEPHGNEVMYNSRTGEQMQTAIFIGPTYYQRLKHMVNDKVHCLKPSHEVLTDKGWKFYNMLEVDDKIATLQDGKLVYARAYNKMWFQNYRGKMYHVKNSQVDLDVTSGHRMFVSKFDKELCRWSDHILYTAESIYKTHVCYKKNAEWIHKDYNLTDAWIVFFGIWIESGWLDKDKSVRLWFDKKRTLNTITESVIGIGYHEYIDEIDLNTVIIRSENLYNMMNELDKIRLPDWVWELSQKQARTLCNTMLSNKESYYTKHNSMADAFMRLCLHAGWAGTKHTRYSKHHQYKVTVIKEDDYIYTHREDESMYHYEGPVWCLEVPGEVFYVRHNGKACWTGNSRSSCGPVVLLTRQPAEGRARDGGLRLGEMEVECNWAHGISSFLKERFMECSDNYRVFICKKCGMISNVNPEKNIYSCKMCRNNTMFSEIRIPYAAKLLFQEVNTMSIGTKFITQ